LHFGPSLSLPLLSYARERRTETKRKTIEETKHKTAQSINKQGRNTGVEGNTKRKKKDRKRNVTKRVEEANKWQAEVFADARSAKG
jgi:hypothetical protein